MSCWRAAYAATRRGGKTVAIGLAHPSQSFSVAAASLVTEERTVMGSYMGSAVPQRDVPRFMVLYRAAASGGPPAFQNHSN